MNDALGEITLDTLIDCGRERIQQFGITFKKADYILDFAIKVKNGRSITPERSAVNNLRNTAGGSVHIVVWQAYMFGWWRAAQFLK